MRQTKVVATLGPATDRPGVLRELVGAGVDVVRLNFSHGVADDHKKRAAAVLAAAEELKRDVGILGDLQGPKIRIESFRGGGVELSEGQDFTLDAGLAHDAGNVHVVATSYTQLPQDVRTGDVLVLNDGAISLEVQEVAGSQVRCKVVVGGLLTNRKGINKLGGGLSAEALTLKDRDDIRLAAEIGVDFLAVSFPRSAADMQLARRLYSEAGGRGQLVAKIERTEAVTQLDALLAESDAVMVARGDLGVEIGDAELPGVQKRIIAAAREQNRLVITATQMMESMIASPVPTRAEVLDVANAVMDGSDAVMLSAETAAGKYPVKAVQAMCRVCIGAERQQVTQRSAALLTRHFERTDEAIAMAAIYTAQNMRAGAIIALTESGGTAIWMSRAATTIPIYALTRHEHTRRRLALCRGVYPVEFDPSSLDGVVAVREAISCLKNKGQLRDGERVLITKGDLDSIGGTNAMKVVKVGEI